MKGTVDRKEMVDETMDRIDQIKDAAGEFRKNIAELVKDMHVENQGWRINVESQEKGVLVDVAIKLLITKK